jgi:ubiquinone/menaquinone biosynthesis C-methylase UbiE
MTEIEKYDSRYSGGYRTKLFGKEYARYRALKTFIANYITPRENIAVLDYGSGNGLFAPLLKESFPKSNICFCDISPVALKQLAELYPEYKDSTKVIENDHVDYPDGSFQVVISIEVMEHVLDLDGYLKEIYRLLKPGGLFVWTTPCGNSFSIEHVYSFCTGNIKHTNEGYRLWKWEDRTHVRRLKTKELTPILEKHGFTNVEYNFRSHFFSFFYKKILRRIPFIKKFQKIIMLDFLLFRHIPNGASMLGVAKKK